ncbi:MAG: ABC transporter ATP-binding protein, partial [Beijerinckiaceae bacterium]
GIATGQAAYRGDDLLRMERHTLNQIRGRKLAMIFQEPMTSLDPLFTIGSQIETVLRHHQKLSRTQARQRAVALLEQVKIPDAAQRINAYPHEMSGGQRQRVMIAMALANDPDILIADEPTTALDVTIQADILRLLHELKTRLGMAIIFITHDLGIVRRFADRVCVMKEGAIVETGDVADMFAAPRHTYTRHLLAAEPAGTKIPLPEGSPVLLEAGNVAVTFQQPRGFLRRAGHIIHAVRDANVVVRRGETIGVVGESGSGKSTLGRALLQLVPASGVVRLEDRALSGLSAAQMRPLRKSMQLVFQDPFGSLSPRMTVGGIVAEGLSVHVPAMPRAEKERRVAQALEEVGLDAAMRNRYPHEFSGGQRQRIAIARTMILQPKFVVLDEPTSALDRTVQKQIVDLLRAMQQKNNLAYLFISHDLAVVRAMADRIIVMQAGLCVEQGPTQDILQNPQQPYTRRLLADAFLKP